MKNLILLLSVYFISYGAKAQCTAKNASSCISKPMGALGNIAPIEETVQTADWLFRMFPLVVGVALMISAARKLSDKRYEEGGMHFLGSVLAFVSLGLANYYLS